MSELGDAVSSAEAVTVGKAAHQLKGSSLTIGAVYVARVAADLEVAAAAGKLAAAGPLLAHLRSALEETAEAFRHRVQPSDAGTKRIGSARPSLTR